MPLKPLRPCNKRGCPNLTRDKYCVDHQEIEEQEKAKRNEYYDKNVRHTRDKKYTTFYHSKAWEITRQQTLIRDKGLCQYCLRQGRITLADMVHHIIEIKMNWSKRLDLNNLICLCNACHNRIHKRGEGE